MTTTTLFSNNRFMSIYRATLLRLRPLVIFYSVVSFFFFPLQYIMTEIGNHNPQYSESFFGLAELYTPLSIFIFSGLMLLIPVLVGAQVYGNMHSKKAVDLYHSLPVSREMLMLGQFSAAMTAISIPLVSSYVITMLVQALTNTLQLRYGIGDMLCWFAIAFVMLAIISFVATQVGTVFDMIIISLGLYGILPLIHLLISFLAERFVYGYEMSGTNWELMSNLSPVSVIVKRIAYSEMYRAERSYAIIPPIDLSTPDLNAASLAVLIWFVIGIALLLGAMKLYQKRSSETAESTSTKGFLKTIVKVAGAFCAGVVMGVVFESIFGTEGYFYFGLVAGIILSYLVMEIVLTRGFKTVLKSLIPASILSIVAVGFVFILANGAFGFERYVPAVSDVQSVSISYLGVYGANSGERAYPSTARKIILEGEEAKQLLHDVHQTQLDLQKQEQWKTEIKYDEEYRSDIQLIYTLNNGKTVRRYYSGLYNDSINLLVQLEANDEFIAKSHPIFRTEYQDISGASLYNALGDNQLLAIREDQFQELKAAIESDLLAATPEQAINAKLPVGYVEFLYKSAPSYEEMALNAEKTYFRRGHYMITEDSKNTLAFLRKHNMEQYIGLDMSNIDKLYIHSYAYGKYGNTSFIHQEDFYGETANSLTASDIYSNQVILDEGYVVTTPTEIASVLSKTQGSVVITQPTFFVTVAPKNPMSDDALMIYPVYLGSLPQNIQDRLKKNIHGYQMDDRGNFDYTNTTYEELSCPPMAETITDMVIIENGNTTFIGGADGSTEILVSSK